MTIKTGVSPRTHYACETCENPVHKDAAYTESYPGHRGTVVLAFCPECGSE